MNLRGTGFWKKNGSLWLLAIAVPICIASIIVYSFRNENTINNTANLKLPKEVSFNFHIRPILSDRCFACHGPDNNKREANLQLDLPESAYAALKDSPGIHGIVPGDPKASAIYQRIITEDESLRMPPVSSNLVLSDYEISLIEKWIRQGAEYEKHWAFIPPEKAAVPKPDGNEWARNEIDYFTLEKMKTKGLTPNEEVNQETLLRRVAIDLTGLPPDPEQLDRFLKDKAAGAYERAVDRLLAAPSYGEKMALHWLDVARYADSYGYQDDQWRTQWPWRDWVIHAFNENMPYSKFLVWQLAGDMLPDATKEQILATGFGRNHKITEEQGAIDEEYRSTYVLDRTNTFSKGILGITMECAQCHDHKYDPVTQKNYFQLYAFFNNTPDKGLTIDNSLRSRPATFPSLEINREDLSGLLRFVNYSDTSHLAVSVMSEREERRKTYVLDRGLYDAPGEEVAPSTPEAILPLDTTRYPRNRLGLAEWTVSRENPLTARVLVNQLWGKVFGKGLVATAGDFGNQGELPSHPELLDWLAVDFMEHGWDIKRLMRQFVTSATYRQSARVTPEKLARDPDNTYLSHASRLRMPAELIRDYVLATSGVLSRQIGGPSSKPYQPDGIWEVTSSGRGNLKRYVQDHGTDLYRRGMYTFIKLTVPPPNMLIFDASNRDQCEVTRLRTNTPLQALVMMNDPIVLEASRVLAGKLLLRTGLTPEDRVALAFRQVLCRQPEQKETEVLQAYYEKEKERFQQSPGTAAAFLKVGEYPQSKEIDPVLQASLMSVVHFLYNLEETITKN